MKNLVLIVLLSSCASFAQEGSFATDAEKDGYVRAKDVKETEKIEDWSFKNAPKNIKFNPFEILSAVPTLGFDFEIQMKDPVISLQMGGGYIPNFLQFTTGNLTDRQMDRMEGYNLRFEPKLHLFGSKKHYMSTEIYFRHLKIQDEMAIGMEPNTNGEFNSFAYFVNENMTFHRFNTRMTFKYGFQHVFNNGFVIDLFSGISLRHNSVFSNSSYPEGGTPTGNWNMLEWRLEDGHRMNYFMPVFGVKLGFAVKK